MPRHVAFLRGVMPTNAKMPALKAAFESAGFENVKTVLGSGNVVFDSSLPTQTQIEQAAEAAMMRSLGRSFHTVVRSVDELRRLIAADPFAAHGIPANAKRVVSFLRVHQEPRVPLPLAEHHASVFLVQGRDVFTAYMPTDRGPVFMALIERCFGSGITTRTLETVIKCAAA